MFCLVVAFIAAPFNSPAKADPVSLLITAIVAATATVVVDYFTCDLNIFFYGCDGAGGGGNGGGGKGSVPLGGDSSIQPIQTPATNPNPTNNSTNPVACTSATANACGMRGTGFIVGGSCNATTPPNSSCPAPVISDKNFYAEPDRVDKGETTTLYWKDIVNATVCTLTGGGLNLTNLGIVGNTPTLEIEQKTEYTLTCQNGAANPDGTGGGPAASEKATVNLIPSYQEV